MRIEETGFSESERQIYRAASELLAKGTDAPTFSARFFGPQGQLNRLGQSRESRQQILRSELYRWLKARYQELRLQDAARFKQDVRHAKPVS